MQFSALKTITAAALLSAATTLSATTFTTTVGDPAGDFLASYTGAKNADLDVTSFTVSYDTVAQAFTLSTQLAGAINTATTGFYVIGVNTGTGTNAPFAGIGAPAVIFNQAILLQKNGTGTVGATALPSVTIAGNTITALVPLSLLPTTGFAAVNYGFNIWPRDATVTGVNAVSDFAPNNATVAVPEPASWALLLAGFGLTGATLRRRSALAA